VPYRAPDGQVLGFVALVQDVTERHRLAAQLQETRSQLEAERARLQGVFQNAPAIICTFRGPQLVYEFSNPLHQRLVGVGRELAGRPVREAVPEAVDQGVVALLERVYQTGEAYFDRELPLRLDRQGDGTPSVRG
jgi:PAS domain-containing protein